MRSSGVNLITLGNTAVLSAPLLHKIKHGNSRLFQIFKTTTALKRRFLSDFLFWSIKNRVALN